MARVTKYSEQWWRRQHMKGTETHIDCEMCRHHGVLYQMWLGGLATRSCTATSPNKNLDYWGMSNAPNWCPLRKRNGGTI